VIYFGHHAAARTRCLRPPDQQTRNVAGHKNVKAVFFGCSEPSPFLSLGQPM
jgi:hypothetical protein